MAQVEWCSLPPELVEAIAEKITLQDDYIRFRVVCRPWRSSTFAIPKHLACQFPWVMLPVAGKGCYHHRAFFDIVSNEIHLLNLPELSHLTRIHRICGSCYGWVVIVEKSPFIYLFNPLTGDRVDLPSLSSFPNISFDISRLGREYAITSGGVNPLGGVAYEGERNIGAKNMCHCFIYKILISRTPVSGSFVAVAILIRGVLAYCKSGENSWKYIKEAGTFNRDVTYLNGLFYAIKDSGEIAVCDLGGDSPVVEFIHTAHVDFICTTLPVRQYVVNCMGQLLLVIRFLEQRKTSRFCLFKLDFGQKRWEEMMSLGDRVLFVGNASSLALYASDFPGCKGNRIYYLDSRFDAEYCNASEDVGIFDLDDCSFHQLPRLNNSSRSLWPPPVWITPNGPNPCLSSLQSLSDPSCLTPVFTHFPSSIFGF